MADMCLLLNDARYRQTKTSRAKNDSCKLGDPEMQGSAAGW